MLPETSISFDCLQSDIRKIYDAAETKCRLNLQQFGPYPVLVEGGGYDKIWLETQPMGGEMYALRNLEAALWNCRLFMEYQRADGRLPGSIRCLPDGQIEPEFNKYQGFCFPEPALNLYYLLGEDRQFLSMLRECLMRFDACLWRTRDSNHDGLLESFCVYDTGEDMGLRYGDAPCWWSEDTPPADRTVVPMASMDVMSWSFASRQTLAEIARIEGDSRLEAHWRAEAASVAKAIRLHLWDPSRGACFDLDRYGRQIPVLCHNTLRCMYWGSLSQDMADTFVHRHLLNPEEFYTPMPLPSIAANDPCFRNSPENNWNGQPEGLTYQRAIPALERYGYHKLVTVLGNRLFQAVADGGFRFTQQFDPFTGQPSLVSAETHHPLSNSETGPIQVAYGPTMLACLEYIAHRWGIHPHMGNVWFSLGSGNPCQVHAVFYGHTYEIDNDGTQAEIRVDHHRPLIFACGERVITSADGQPIRRIPIE